MVIMSVSVNVKFFCFIIWRSGLTVSIRWRKLPRGRRRILHQDRPFCLPNTSATASCPPKRKGVTRLTVAEACLQVVHSTFLSSQPPRIGSDFPLVNMVCRGGTVPSSHPHTATCRPRPTALASNLDLDPRLPAAMPAKATFFTPSRVAAAEVMDM